MDPKDAGGVGGTVAGAIVQGFEAVGNLLAGSASTGGSNETGTGDLQNADNVRSQAEKRLESQRKDLTRNFAG